MDKNGMVVRMSAKQEVRGTRFNEFLTEKVGVLDKNILQEFQKYTDEATNHMLLWVFVVFTGLMPYTVELCIRRGHIPLNWVMLLLLMASAVYAIADIVGYKNGVRRLVTSLPASSTDVPAEYKAKIAKVQKLTWFATGLLLVVVIALVVAENTVTEQPTRMIMSAVFCALLLALAGLEALLVHIVTRETKKFSLAAGTRETVASV